MLLSSTATKMFSVLGTQSGHIGGVEAKGFHIPLKNLYIKSHWLKVELL